MLSVSAPGAFEQRMPGIAQWLRRASSRGPARVSLAARTTSQPRLRVLALSSDPAPSAAQASTALG